MNIKVQCCGIVLIVLIAVLFEIQRKLKLTSSNVFRLCIYTSIICLALDIASLFGIVYSDRLPDFLPIFICKTYLASLVLVGWLSVIYISLTVSVHLRYYTKIIAASAVFALVTIVLVYVLPINVHLSEDKTLAWTDGPSCNATYGGMLLLIIFNIIQLFLRKNYIYARQRVTVLAWMLMWIVAATVQVFLNEFLDAGLLIVGFAGALGVALVYFQFENPELNLDKNTKLFNYIAFTRYGEQLYSGHKNFYAIAILLDGTAWQNAKNTDESIAKKYEMFLTVSGSDVFRIMEDEILLIFSDEKKAKAFFENLKVAVAQDLDASRICHSFYYVEDPKCVATYRELLELIQYYSFQKKDGKPGSFYTIDTSVVYHMLTERKMVKQIVEALEEDRVVVYYQPIYSIENKRFTSAEALVRILDRDGKLIPPGSFIKIAETNGMIIDIGKRVLEKVCNFFIQSKLEEYGVEYIEVNLSVVQCADDKLADDYIEIIDRFNMEPGRINLEITESASLHEKQTLIKNMEKLIEYGVHFSLDDFGTGESNLNYIVDMPVNIVKFDRMMIGAYFSSGKAKYVMDAAMHMISGMGLSMVAEGVETEEQYKKMEEINMNFIQGYYFSKPLPEQDFLDFLRRENSED